MDRSDNISQGKKKRKDEVEKTDTPNSETKKSEGNWL